MSFTGSEWRALIDQLPLEGELAPGAAVASDVGGHYDRTAAALLRAGDPVVLALLLGRIDDDTPVRQATPPHDYIDGGYGRSAGPITVGDKARFLLRRLLGAARAEEAFCGGADWARGRRFVWEAEAGRFR